VREVAAVDGEGDSASADKGLRGDGCNSGVCCDNDMDRVGVANGVAEGFAVAPARFECGGGGVAEGCGDGGASLPTVGEADATEGRRLALRELGAEGSGDLRSARVSDEPGGRNVALRRNCKADCCGCCSGEGGAAAPGDEAVLEVTLGLGVRGTVSIGPPAPDKEFWL